MVDFCAGAGGKTLALAAAMKNKGKLVASDVLKGRIERAATRLSRAGVHNVERRGLSASAIPGSSAMPARSTACWWMRPAAAAAPGGAIPTPNGVCSPSDIDELVDLQRRILESAARLVKPGGRLVYATCSLLPAREPGADRLVSSQSHPGFHRCRWPMSGAACSAAQPPADAVDAGGLISP